MKLVLFFSTVFLAVSAFAANEVQTLKGTGIDGQACEVKITRDGNKLKNIEMTGASEVFEIIAENGSSYGPKTSIRPRGGSETIMAKDSLLPYFQHSENFFSEGETFTVDTSDLPKNDDEESFPFKVTVKIALSYENNALVSVNVVNKAKAAVIIPMASSKFTCDL